MMTWVDPLPRETVTFPGMPALTAVVALLEMSWPLLKFTFEVPGFMVPCWYMDRKPAPLGSPQARLHNTAEIPDGIVLDPNVPVTAMSRDCPTDNGPFVLRES